MRDGLFTEVWNDVHWFMSESTDSYKLDLIEGERDSRLQSSSKVLILNGMVGQVSPTAFPTLQFTGAAQDKWKGAARNLHAYKNM